MYGRPSATGRGTGLNTQNSTNVKQRVAGRGQLATGRMKVFRDRRTVTYAPPRAATPPGGGLLVVRQQPRQQPHRRGLQRRRLLRARLLHRDDDHVRPCLGPLRVLACRGEVSLGYIRAGIGECGQSPGAHVWTCLCGCARKGEELRIKRSASFDGGAQLLELLIGAGAGAALADLRWPLRANGEHSSSSPICGCRFNASIKHAPVLGVASGGCRKVGATSWWGQTCVSWGKSRNRSAQLGMYIVKGQRSETLPEAWMGSARILANAWVRFLGRLWDTAVVLPSLRLVGGLRQGGGEQLHALFSPILCACSHSLRF